MKNSAFLDRYAKFNVSKLTRITFVIPLVIVLIAIAVIIGVGETTGNYSSAVGIGIDFQGGTMLTVNGLEDNDELQATIDSVEQTIESVEDSNGSHVTVSYIQRLEGRGGISVTFRYQNVSGNDDVINALNNAIIAAVGEQFYPDGDVPSDFITYESIGATAAQDLLSKAGIALAVSTVLILIYILIRFTPTAAFAAVLALLHDVIVMFALTVICRVQINSSFVAAMITIIAYSINNTIITATTMITVIFLAILGSDSIREFCVPIILGLFAGLFSSVCLATPMWAAFTRGWDKFKAKRAATAVYGGGTSSSDDEDREQILAAPKKEDDDDDDEFAPKRTEKPAGAQKKGNTGGGKPKGKPIYKYSKKNTKFKDKK